MGKKRNVSKQPRRHYKRERQAGHISHEVHPPVQVALRPYAKRAERISSWRWVLSKSGRVIVVAITLATTFLALLSYQLFVPALATDFLGDADRIDPQFGSFKITNPGAVTLTGVESRCVPNVLIFETGDSFLSPTMNRLPDSRAERVTPGESFTVNCAPLVSLFNHIESHEKILSVSKLDPADVLYIRHYHSPRGMVLQQTTRGTFPGHPWKFRRVRIREADVEILTTFLVLGIPYQFKHSQRFRVRAGKDGYFHWYPISKSESTLIPDWRKTVFRISAELLPTIDPKGLTAPKSLGEFGADGRR